MDIFKKHKSKLIFVAALLTPGGFIMLGLVKAYQFYQARAIALEQKPKTYEEFVESLKKDAEADDE